ncbi:MAG: hypothetical protein NO516_04930 [Candidatus Methanomethylicia archaeon]|uniref:Type IV pilin n=1 Tax=Candidatus Methanomethylicus mesodigestus TaxID=1867258 RepID=A0A7C3FCH3_9CREN|nr:hypothetical protein [Candidatus Methanomethylicia archaeon]
MRRIVSSKKGEISTPIITILVTVAALAVTGVAITWMISTGTSASSQGAIIVIGSPVVQNDTLYVTVKNIGNTNTALSSCLLGDSSVAISPPRSISAGESTVLTIGFNQTFASGQTLRGSLNTNQGIYQFTAYVQ